MTTTDAPAKPASKPRKKMRTRKPGSDGLVTTQSLWGTFMRCEKRAEWGYVHKLRPIKTPEPLEFGTLFHNCMEIWYGRHMLPPAMRENTGLIMSIIQETIDTFYPRWPDAVDAEGVIIQDDAEALRHLRSKLLMTAMLRGYTKKYPSEAWKLLAIETEFRVPIRNPMTNHRTLYDLKGKIDLLVEENGELVLVDHKTAKFIDSNYILGLELDLQVHLYAIHVAKHLNLDRPISSVRYNVIKKCQLKGTKGEKADDLLARMETWYEDDEAYFRHDGIPMDERKCALFEKELWHRSRVWDKKVTGVEPFLRNTTACFNPKAMCPYTELCKTGSTLDEVQLVVQDQFVVAGDAHPELSDDMLDPNLVATM